MKISPIKRSDWVRCKAGPAKWIGSVVRVARDGSWADVNWHSHTKRMRVAALEVLTTIPISGVTLTDETRAEELRSLAELAE